jgi:hypothetical protein
MKLDRLLCIGVMLDWCFLHLLLLLLLPLLPLLLLPVAQYSPTIESRAAESWSLGAFYSGRDGCTAESAGSTAFKSSKGCATGIGDCC